MAKRRTVVAYQAPADRLAMIDASLAAIRDPAWGKHYNDADRERYRDSAVGRLRTERADAERDAAIPRTDAVAIDRGVAALVPFTEQYDARPILATVTLRKGRAYASDGFALAWVDLPDPVPMREGIIGWRTPGDGDVVISRRLAATGGKARDPRGAVLGLINGADVAVDPSFHSGAIVQTDRAGVILGGGDRMHVDGIGVDFPDVDKILDLPDPIATVAIGAGYLRKVGEFFTRISANWSGGAVQMDVREPGSAITFRATGTGERAALVAVMPMVVGPDGGLPPSDADVQGNADGAVRMLRAYLERTAETEHPRTTARRALVTQFLNDWNAIDDREGSSNAG